MKSIFLLAGTLLLQYKGQSQASAGDKIGHWCISNVQPGQREQSLETYKGKFIILDFFSSSCVACFKSLPRIHELQQKFNAKLKFIMIGKDDARIRAIYRKYEERFQLTLTVAFDSVIFAKQKIESVPSYLWVDDESIVRGITGIEQLTEKNINEFLNRDYSSLHKELQQKIPFDETKPILAGGNGAPDSLFLYRSLLLRWNPSMETSFPPSIEYITCPFTFQVMGVTIQSLYNYAYIGADDWRAGNPLYGRQFNRPLWAAGDSALLQQKFSYSLSLPPSQFGKKQLQNQMKQDLFRVFGYTVDEEIRDMPCWKLVAKPEARLRLRSKKTEKKITGSKVSVDYEYVPVFNLIKVLQAYTFPHEILIDETGIREPIDIRLDAVLTDPGDVNKALLAKGLELVKTKIPMRVIVIRPAENNPAPAAKAGTGF